MTRNQYYCIACSLLLSSWIGMAKNEHEKVFTSIYDNAVWGRNAKGEGFSGGGSLLKNSKRYMRFVQHFVKAHNVKTIVDAGCGDWEFSRYMDWNGARYLGYDVVASVIENNIKQFSKDNIRFIHANFLVEDLPKADLLLCKHVLQHLPNEDILAFIQQLKKFKYCLITNEVYPDTLSSDGVDIEIGGGHKIDLTLAPFNVVGTKLSYLITA